MPLSAPSCYRRVGISFSQCSHVSALKYSSSLRNSLSHPPPLVALRQHHDDGRLLLKNHLPEVVAGLWKRTLGGDVLPGVFVALKIRKEGPAPAGGCMSTKIRASGSDESTAEGPHRDVVGVDVVCTFIVVHGDQLDAAEVV